MFHYMQTVILNDFCLGPGGKQVAFLWYQVWCALNKGLVEATKKRGEWEKIVLAAVQIVEDKGARLGWWSTKTWLLLKLLCKLGF